MVAKLKDWQRVWRDGFAPILPVDVLRAILKGLEDDDKTLLQGQTTNPPPQPQYADWLIEGGDVFSFGFWKAELASTVGQAEEIFARLCFESDQRLGSPAECRYFLDWFDDSPRKQVLEELAREVKRTLADHAKQPVGE